MPYTEDQVYKAENFRFATFDLKRGKPTLYFRTNHGSGRIRQAHKSGPLVQEIRKHYSHAFFYTKENARKFFEEIKKEILAGENSESCENRWVDAIGRLRGIIM